ncbi:molybdenum cofactor guanylyltransferase [Halostagnicola larsenii XH-48]|uniref:Probable molybdenum cofactor guanylyltransferase n=1 Tax=Halostagnicola larsenii XH-48 TaxID=797299 RepID=W0JRZ2_9EURY|nr:molybdenum cofactor guanylyltransferase [Halostagnicola larsenii]AHF99762.1 molybdenum cofactor guanylyltransferase [Halostagnicola larsenii XH-48]
MPVDSSVGGVVLAGGYSTRFGDADKSIAELEGTPMIRRVADRIAAVTDDVVVNCRSEQKEPIADALSGANATIRFAIDPIPDRGPVAGIHAGLEECDREYAAVVACDMPFVDPALLETLLDRARGRDGAVVELEAGWLQTTQAVYRTDAMARACAATIGEEDNRVVAALEKIDWVSVPEASLEGISEKTFESIDTQEALDDAERRI